jgi:hypothetical protein
MPSGVHFVREGAHLAMRARLNEEPLHEDEIPCEWDEEIPPWCLDLDPDDEPLTLPDPIGES